jgi:hypothetical protein
MKPGELGLLLVTIFGFVVFFILEIFFLYVPTIRTEAKIELVSNDLEAAIDILLKTARDVEELIEILNQMSNNTNQNITNQSSFNR